jgi:hypothetical protein
MGRGLRQRSDAQTPARARTRTQAGNRPYQRLSDDELERRIADAEAAGDRRLALELERELWRRPGGSGFEYGKKIGPLEIAGIDADRLRILIRLPDGGLKSLTRKQMINIMSGQAPLPTRPDRRTPPQPVDYGQHAPAPKRPHPAHQPVEGHPESARFAAERKRIDEQRDRMSEIRDQTDIVEFERLYWLQHEAHLNLAREVEAAGGLDPQQGSWGARYVIGDVGWLERETERKRQVYEHIKKMREDGASDSEIIRYLEAVYDSPWGGPKPRD